jgi:hypothetical protein
MSNLGTLVISTTVPALLRLIYTRSAAGEAVRDHDSIVFPESRVVPIIRWAALLLFSALAFVSWTYAKSLLGTLISAAFVLIAILARGDSVVITRDGISGASTWGRRSSIPWSEVVSIEFNAGNSNTTVIGTTGAKICHSGFHLDKSRFELEVKRRTGLPVKVIQPGTWKPKVSYR